MTCSYRFADLVVSSEESLPELPAAPAAAVPDVVVTRVEKPFDVPVRWFQHWGGDDSVRFGRAGAHYVVAFEGVDVVVSPGAERIALHPADDVSEFRLRHLLLHQVLPLVMSRRGRCVLHASAVSWHGRIAAFVGRTGAGKSTIAAACASLGAALVTDDSLMLHRSADGWDAVPSYPGLRLLPESLALIGRAASAGERRRPDDKILLMSNRDLPAFEGRALPLGRLFLLAEEDEGEATRPLPGGSAAIALASQLFRLDIEDEAESRRLFDAITDLAIAVPVSRLVVDRGAEGLRRVAQAALDLVCGSGNSGA